MAATVTRREPTPRAVKFDRYGGIDVLRVVEVDRPVPGPEQVLIRMKAAGINPGEAAIREGAFAKQWPATFPSGQGSDLAGVVEAVGSAVRNVAVGDEVIWRAGMLIQYAAAGILFALGAMAFETRIVHWTPEFLFALCWLVIVLSFGAIWLLYFLISRAAATRVVSLFYLTPPVTALMAWALFNERLAMGALAGMAFCVIGVFLVNWQSAGR
jgi:uncharacterized membrane protein